MRIYSSLLLCLLIVNNAICAHILVFHLNKIGSYKKFLDGIVETLATEHKISLYSLVHQSFPHPNVTVNYIDVPPLQLLLTEGLFESLCDRGPFYISSRTVMGLKKDFIEDIYKAETMQQLLKTNKSYDLVMTFAALAEFSFQFAHKLNAPLVQISATFPLIPNNEGVGNPPFLSTVYTFHGHKHHNSFFNRIIIYMQNLLFYVRYYVWYVPLVNSVTSEYFPSGTPSVAEMNRNTSLLLANVHVGMGHARPQMPNVVEIGGMHCKVAQPLPTDLEQFISGAAEHGIIYFSFGNSIRSKFPEYITRAILAAFQKLPQRILWKWNDDISDLPANVKVSKWFPQQDILGHNKTKLFVTQGGMFSMQEASFHGVPVLVIPIAYDQQTNAILAEEMGYSKHIDFCEFSEDEFLALVKELISNSKYKRNAKKISQLMRDEPMKATDKLNWWINFIIRHKGNPTTNQIKERYTGLTRSDVDIIAFLVLSLLLTFIIFCYSMYITIKYTIRLKYFQFWKIKMS